MVSYIILLFLFHFAFNVHNNNAITLQDVFNADIDEEETFLTDDDFREALTVEDEDLESLGIEISHLDHRGKFEGDIYGFSMDTMMDGSSGDGTEGTHRYATLIESRKWSSGQVPYVISSQYGSYARATIAKAFEEFRRKTCIQFIPKSANHRDYIYIEKKDGCFSLLGKEGGRQTLSLAESCIRVGIIIHELLHAVGIFHEQSRMDRDSYVHIFRENIIQGAEDQFAKYPGNNLDLPYDLNSVMHYEENAFTKNGRATIKAKNGEKLGQRYGFSALDLQKVNKFYNCGNNPRATRRPSGNSRELFTRRPFEELFTVRTFRPIWPKERRTQRPVIPIDESEERPVEESGEPIDQSRERSRICPRNFIRQNVGMTRVSNAMMGNNIGILFGSSNIICTNVGTISGSYNILCRNFGVVSGYMNGVCHHSWGICSSCSKCANIANC